MRISGIQNPAIDQLSQAGSNGVVSGKGGQGKGGDFADTLMDVLKEVNETQQDAVSKQNAFMTGQPVDYHDLMISMEKASTSLQLTMAIRNKVLDAYTEISKLQV